MQHCAAILLPAELSCYVGELYDLLTYKYRGVTRICCEEGQNWKLGHGALTVDFRAGCSKGLMTNSFVTNAVLMQMKEL